jgi:hypothetical protein
MTHAAVVNQEEVTMVRATFLEERRTWEERARPARQVGVTCFRWSLAKMRIAALVATRWSVRIGAYCQIGYGVPADTISMLLVKGNVSEVLDAVAQYRPDLLHQTNRRGILTANPQEA